MVNPTGGVFSTGTATLDTTATATDLNYQIPLTKTHTTSATLS